MMNSIPRRMLLVIIVCILSLPFLSAQTVNHWQQDGKIYLKLKDNINWQLPSGDWGKMNLGDAEFLSAFISEYQITGISKPFFTNNDKTLSRIYKVEFNEIYKIEQFIKELENQSYIEYAEPVPIFRPYLTVNDTWYNQNVSTFFTSANTSWHLQAINAEAAWDITTGDPNIKVAVLDNAIWTGHPDLANKIAFEIDLGDSDSLASPPASTYIWSHGTHSAGLIGAETNNNLGVASIGYNVSLIAVKLGQDASDGQGMTAGFEGIVWAADNGADVISMSWGSPQYFQTMQNTINYAYNKGCVLLAAAGNNGNGMETQVNPDIPVNYMGYPAALHNVIAVGSSDSGDNKSDFSNYGTWIDVLSPGGYDDPGFLGMYAFSVLSTVANDAGGLNEVLNGASGGAGDYGISGKYDVMQGTSMACPVAAGLAGLMLSVNPDLTPGELTAIMKATCANVDAQNAAFVDSIGAGRIDAAAAVQAVLDSMAGQTIIADFMASDISIMPGETIDFTDMSIGTPVSWQWTFEGATPSTSNDQNPVGIEYTAEGLYWVSLEVSDGTNTDIEVKNFLINVGGFDMPQSAWLRQASGFETEYRGLLEVDIVDENTAWALSYDGTSGSITTDFTRTVDAGVTWTPGVIDVGVAGLAPGNITAVSADIAWVGMYQTTGGGGIYKTTDAGITWTHQPSAAFADAASFTNVVHFFDANNGFCMGDPINNEFEIYTTTDGGDNWVLLPGANIPNPTSGEMGWTGVYDAVGDTIWFGTNTGRIYKSIDKGNTWNVYTTGEANVSEITFNDGMNGLILCANFNQTTGQMESWAMRSTTDGGQTWQLVSNDMNNTKSDIAAVPGVPGMFVSTKISQATEENGSFYSYDFGNTWTQLDDSIQYTCVDFYSETVGWAGSFNLSSSFEGVYKWIGIPNTTPYFTSSPVIDGLEFSTYTYNAIAVDPDSTILTMEASVLPAWLTFTDNGDNTGTLTGVPQTPDVGTHSVTLIAYNATDTASQSFTITVLTSDLPPVFTSTPVEEGWIGAIYTYNVTATDPDMDALSFQLVTAPGFLSLTDNGDGTALLTGIPTSASPQQPGYAVTIRCSDGTLSEDQSFAIWVPFQNPYDPPVFTSTPVEVALYNELYTYNVTASDPDGDTVVFDASLLPDWLTLVDNGNNTAVLSGTPVTLDTVYSVTLTINDGLFPLVSQSFTITIDQAPEFTSVPDTSAVINEAYMYNITATDADGDALSFTCPVLPAWLSFTDNTDNTAELSGTPTQLTTGNGSEVSVIVTDGLVNVEQHFYIDVVTNGIYTVNNERLNVYPNPATERIFIEYSNSSRKQLEITLYDILGEVVYAENVQSGTDSYNFSISVENYVKGVYMLKIISGNTISLDKIIIE